MSHLKEVFVILYHCIQLGGPKVVKILRTIGWVGIMVCVTISHHTIDRDCATNSATMHIIQESLNIKENFLALEIDPKKTSLNETRAIELIICL